MPGYPGFYQQQPYGYQPTMQMPPPMMESMAQLRQPGQMQPQPVLLGRAVSDVAEARAVPSDLSGQPMFFPDLAHDAIHVKIFNPNTGAGDFYTFRRVYPQAAPPPEGIAPAQPPRYALADDLDALRAEVQAVRNDIGRVMASKTEVTADA